MAFASGKVTSVSGSTVNDVGHQHQSGSSRRPTQQILVEDQEAHSAQDREPQGHDVELTTVSATQRAASRALAVGDCVSAFGPAASNGAVTATTVRITSTSGDLHGRLPGEASAAAAVPAAASVGALPVVAVPRSTRSGWGRAGHRRAVLAGVPCCGRPGRRRRRLGPAASGARSDYRMASVTGRHRQTSAWSAPSNRSATPRPHSRWPARSPP